MPKPPCLLSLVPASRRSQADPTGEGGPLPRAIAPQLQRNPAPTCRGGSLVGGGRQATHRLLSLAPVPDHSPHPPLRPRARHDIILCSKTPPCLPRVLPLQRGGQAGKQLGSEERWDPKLTAKTDQERQEAATCMLKPVAFIHAPQVLPETRPLPKAEIPGA